MIERDQAARDDIPQIVDTCLKLEAQDKGAPTASPAE